MNINNKDVIQSYIMTTAKYDFSADESSFGGGENGTACCDSR